MLKVCVPVYWYSELIHPISFNLSYIFFFHITIFEVRIQLTIGGMSQFNWQHISLWHKN